MADRGTMQEEVDIAMKAAEEWIMEWQDAGDSPEEIAGMIAMIRDVQKDAIDYRSAERTCYVCSKRRVCLIRCAAEELTSKMNLHRMLNIDGFEAPGRMLDLHAAVASMCLLFVRGES